MSKFLRLSALACFVTAALFTTGCTTKDDPFTFNAESNAVTVPANTDMNVRVTTGKNPRIIRVVPQPDPAAVGSKSL